MRRWISIKVAGINDRTANAGDVDKKSGDYVR
jgi:hypothetical protein